MIYQKKRNLNKKSIRTSQEGDAFCFTIDINRQLIRFQAFHRILVSRSPGAE